MGWDMVVREPEQAGTSEDDPKYVLSIISWATVEFGRGKDSLCQKLLTTTKGYASVVYHISSRSKLAHIDNGKKTGCSIYQNWVLR